VLRSRGTIVRPKLSKHFTRHCIACRSRFWAGAVALAELRITTNETGGSKQIFHALQKAAFQIVMPLLLPKWPNCGPLLLANLLANLLGGDADKGPKQDVIYNH